MISTHSEIYDCYGYDIDGDTLKVNYALDYVTDYEYTYTVDDGKMTLVGGNGTAEPGTPTRYKMI